MAENDKATPGSATRTGPAQTGEVLPPVDLAALAKQINDAHTAIIRDAKSAVTRAIAAGVALIEAKANVPDGTWLRWLSGNCIISDRTAQTYMQLAKNKLAVEQWLRDGTQQVADQTLNGALKMLRGPSDRPPPAAPNRHGQRFAPAGSQCDLRVSVILRRAPRPRTSCAHGRSVAQPG